MGPGDAGGLTCLHFFIETSGGWGCDLIGGTLDLKGWDKWTQGTEKSLGQCGVCSPTKSWLHVTVTDETAFTSPSPPALKEAAPKILQCGEDPVGL